jgi:DNA-binding GntR family transcriptional regulator
MTGVLVQDQADARVAGERTVTRHNGLADEVYEAILARLTALKIAPGARITVDTLARELDVSQTPIREALGRLEGEGLVVKKHLVGYSAAPQLTRARFEELYELRLLLEPEAARKAAARMSRAELDALTEVGGAMSRAQAGDERLRYSAFARQDAIFHDAIAGIAGNGLVRHTLAYQHMHFHIFRLVENSRVAEEALSEHQALLTAFSAGDADAAARAMRLHIQKSRERLLASLE